MTRNHSWNRLLSRSTRVRPANPSASSAVRPPLAELERLEDRVLLSASSSDGTSSALIGLLRGQIDLRSAEINALKVVGSLLPAVQSKVLSDAFLKIEDSFLKIEDALYKITENALTDQKVSKGDVEQKVHLEDQINNEFAKVNEEVKLFGENGQGQLLPAVQRVQDMVTSALASLDGTVKLDPKSGDVFVKVEDDFMKIGDIADKWTSDDLLGHTHKGELDKVDIKLDDAFVKLDADIAAMGDGSVFKGLADDLASMKIQTLNFVDAFGAPPIITEPTTDVIT